MKVIVKMFFWISFSLTFLASGSLPLERRVRLSAGEKRRELQPGGLDRTDLEGDKQEDVNNVSASCTISLLELTSNLLTDSLF